MVDAAWEARHRRGFAREDADAIFAVFEPMTVAAVRDHADLISAAVEAIVALRPGEQARLRGRATAPAGGGRRALRPV